MVKISQNVSHLFSIKKRLKVVSAYGQDSIGTTPRVGVLSMPCQGCGGLMVDPTLAVEKISLSRTGNTSVKHWMSWRR